MQSGLSTQHPCRHLQCLVLLVSGWCVTLACELQARQKGCYVLRTLPCRYSPMECAQDPNSSGMSVQAMGRALLLELDRGRHAGEGFLLCRQLAVSSEFAVLTEQHLLCIAKLSQSSAPTLRWAVALSDVFHFDR